MRDPQVVSPVQAFALVGELYIENRLLREQLEEAKKKIAELTKGETP